MRALRMAIRERPPSLAGAVFCATCTMILANAAFAMDSTSIQRFQLSGTGTLTPDQPVQKSGNIQLKAYLTSKDAALAALPPVQESSGFALMAKLAAKPSVCYNDTIFRDDFDGDGF
jgi:hypothetical protein